MGWGTEQPFDDSNLNILNKAVVNMCRGSTHGDLIEGHHEHVRT